VGDNIEMLVKKMQDGRIRTEDRDQWWALMSTVIIHLVS
jgi:hypothetical protein